MSFRVPVLPAVLAVVTVVAVAGCGNSGSAGGSAEPASRFCQALVSYQQVMARGPASDDTDASAFRKRALAAADEVAATAPDSIRDDARKLADADRDALEHHRSPTKDDTRAMRSVSTYAAQHCDLQGP